MSNSKVIAIDITTSSGIASRFITIHISSLTQKHLTAIEYFMLGEPEHVFDHDRNSETVPSILSLPPGIYAVVVQDAMRRKEARQVIQ